MLGRLLRRAMRWRVLTLRLLGHFGTRVLDRERKGSAANHEIIFRIRTQRGTRTDVSRRWSFCLPRLLASSAFSS